MSAKKMELHFQTAQDKTWKDERGKLWRATVHFRFDEAGLRVTELHLVPMKAPRKDFPPAITTRLLQRLPLDRWCSEFAAGKAAQLKTVAGTWAAMPHMQEQLALAGRGPRSSSRAFYGEVAQVYIAALTAHQSPTKAVSERWEVSRTLAATWIYRARQAGLLGKTSQGRAKA